MRPVSLSLLLVFVVAGCQCGAPGRRFELAAANPLDFGRIAMGTRATLGVDLLNTGETDVELVAVDGTTAVFLVDRTAVIIPPKRAVKVNIIFAPPVDVDATVMRREHGAELLFRASDQTEVLLSVKGTALRAACSAPQLLDFGAVVVNDVARRRIDGPGITLGAVTGDMFAATADASGLEVTFRPTRPGEFVGELLLRRGEFCPADAKVTMRGTAVDTLLECDPAPLDFGYVTPGFTKSSRLRISNRGSSPIELSGLQARIGVSPSTEFLLTGPTAVTVPGASRPGGQWVPGQVELELGFKPVLLGARKGTLSATTSAPTMPMLSCFVQGFGGGPDIDVRPTTLDFGRVPVFANNGVTRKVTLQNLGSTDGTNAANLHVRSWSVTPKNTASSLSDVCVGPWDATLRSCSNSWPAGYDPAVGIAARAGTGVDFPITVTPSVPGDLEWDVTFLSDDVDEPSVTVNVRVRAVVLLPCSYSVTPAALSFGLLAARPLTLTLALTNTSTEACLISWLDVEPGTSAVFSLPGGPLADTELQPGQTLLVPVRATPPPTRPLSLQTVAGGLVIHANMPSAPQLKVPLSAQIGPGCLVVSPGEHEFGSVKKDCGSAPRAFSVYNTCATAVTVQQAGVSAAGAPPGTPGCPGTTACPELRISGTPTLGAGTVLPGSSAAPATFALEYRPLDVGADRGSFVLKVVENGRTVDYVIPLSGTGALTGQRTDTFTQDSKPKADLLFVVDNSPSMIDDQMRLMQNGSLFNQLMQYMNSAGVDYRVGVTVTDLTVPDVGKLVGTPAVITPQTPATLSQRLLVGTSGSLNRGVAEPAVRAISGLNPGFPRDDATLSIIGITDGPDRSAGSAGLYEAMLVEAKRGNRRAVSYGVIGPSWPAQAGCNTDDAWPSVSKLRVLTLAFGGSHVAICQPNWMPALESLGKVAFGYRASFPLTAAPELSGGAMVVVKIDHGQGIGPEEVAPVDPRGAPVWSLDTASSTVNFEPIHVPAPGDVITVTYTAVCH